MQRLHKKFAELIAKHAPSDGVYATPLPGVFLGRISDPGECRNVIWAASLVFGAQGQKEVVIERHLYRYGAGQYMASPVDLPITSRAVSVNKENPYLALAVPLARADLVDILKRTKFDRESGAASGPGKPFVGETTEPLLRCAIRLVETLDDEEEAAVVGPLILKELIFRFLRSENGARFLDYVREGDRASKVADAIEAIKTQPSRRFDLDAFAKSAHMSRANFFRTFKSATAMSPVQYQKQLRLLEARRLLLETSDTVETAAYKVGYKSTSQFNRDYARRFGSPPKRDTRSH